MDRRNLASLPFAAYVSAVLKSCTFLYRHLSVQGDSYHMKSLLMFVYVQEREPDRVLNEAPVVFGLPAPLKYCPILKDHMFIHS